MIKYYYKLEDCNMALDNKLGISDARELAHEEERLTKKRALELYDNKILDTFEIGTYAGAAEASFRLPERTHYQELSHRHDHHHKKNRNTHSQGDVNTAAIVGVAVGAIAGAVIANNT